MDGICTLALAARRPAADGARLGYEYSWQDGGFGGLNPEYQSWDGEPKLCTKPTFEQSGFSLIATHPSGTRGQFEFKYLRRTAWV